MKPETTTMKNRPTPHQIAVPCPKCQTKNWFLVESAGDSSGESYDISNAPMDVLEGINKNGPVTCGQCQTEYAVKLTLEMTITSTEAPKPPEPTEEEIQAQEIPECFRKYFT